MATTLDLFGACSNSYTLGGNNLQHDLISRGREERSADWAKAANAELASPPDGFVHLAYSYDKESGHGGVSYFNPDNGELIIAHRGTASFKDVITDASMARKEPNTPQGSLADMAVDALAHVRSMGAGMDDDHPQRHSVRRMRQAAEKAIEAAFIFCSDLAYEAEQIAKTNIGLVPGTLVEIDSFKKKIGLEFEDPKFDAGWKACEKFHAEKQ
jgi:hypothetical protein